MINNIKNSIKFFMAVLIFSFMTGCSLMNVPSSFQFDNEKTNTSLVAFSVACKGIDQTDIESYMIEGTTDKMSYFTFDCTENENGRIQILNLPAGAYTFAAIRYFKPGGYHHAVLNKLYFFVLQPHKLTYIGRISYNIGEYSVLVNLSDASIVDIPEIKLAVPQVSIQDYVVKFWGRDSSGNFVAQ